MRVLVTGANGFVGRALCEALGSAGIYVRAAVRTSQVMEQGISGSSEVVAVGSIGYETDWSDALDGCEVVVHLAARVHQMRDTAADPLEAFREVNTRATLALARQAAAAGVRRFVYLSSIKVNGEGGAAAYQADEPANPQDPYAVSKWEAELGLHTIAVGTAMQVVVLRPPLIYGPGVGANFLRLMSAVERGWPLPLGLANNRRSLLYVGNLVDAIRVCMEHPSAAGRTYLLADEPPVSTADLIRELAAALGRTPRLLPVPLFLLRLAATLMGKRAAMQRLLGSLEVEGSAIRAELDWQAPFTMQQGLAETARWYRARIDRA